MPTNDIIIIHSKTKFVLVVKCSVSELFRNGGTATDGGACLVLHPACAKPPANKQQNVGLVTATMLETGGQWWPHFLTESLTDF